MQAFTPSMDYSVCQQIEEGIYISHHCCFAQYNIETSLSAGVDVVLAYLWYVGLYIVDNTIM